MMVGIGCVRDVGSSAGGGDAVALKAFWATLTAPGTMSARATTKMSR
jgi:hypothetical protein